LKLDNNGRCAAPSTDEPEWLGYAQAAKFLSINLNTLYMLVAQRRIPHSRLGPRLVRFSRTALRAWLEEHAVEPSEYPPDRRSTDRRKAR
jgi:excisionase family DNA binding protein